MKPVASLFSPVIITFILVAGSSGKRTKHSIITTEAVSDIAPPFHAIESSVPDIDSSYHHLYRRSFPFIRHHKSGHQERILCEEPSQCGDTRTSSKFDSQTPNSSPSSTTVKPAATHHRTSSTTDFFSQMSERVRERQASQGATKKGGKKNHHHNKRKKDAWRKHGFKDRENTLEHNEFLNLPQSDASNNVVHYTSNGISGADSKTSTEKPTESPNPSNSASSAGCVNKPENITMCVKDILTNTSSAVVTESTVTGVPSETTTMRNNIGTAPMPSDEELQFEQNHAYVFENFCKNPVPELISVSEYHTDKKSYSPALTVLHHCRSPCCDVDDRCVPATTENINLYFKVLTYSANSTTILKSSSYEKLDFKNHTSCTCYSKGQPMNPISEMNEIQRDAPSGETNDEDNANEEEEEEEEEEEVVEEREKQMKHNIKEYKSYFRSCGCAVPFVENSEDGPCRCDCNKEDGSCLSLKVGTSYIDHGWWRCIKARKCTAPECQYGNFLMQFGRCPKKKEYLDRL